MSFNHVGNTYLARLADMAKTPEEFRVEAKFYYHQHNHAMFHFDLGGSKVKSVAFVNNLYITDDKREQDQLDAIADVPGSFIYTSPNNQQEQEFRTWIEQYRNDAVVAAAQARSAVAGQQFDPRVPIVPVLTDGQVQNQQQRFAPPPLTPVNIRQAPPPVPAQENRQPAIVGTQNTFSGTTATPNVADKNAARRSSAETAAAEIERMTQELNAQRAAESQAKAAEDKVDPRPNSN